MEAQFNICIGFWVNGNSRIGCFKPTFGFLRNEIKRLCNKFFFCFTKMSTFCVNKGRHGTDPWPTPYCLDIFPTPQRLQNMPFIAYGDMFVLVRSIKWSMSE